MKIQIPEINVIIRANGFWEGIILKRHLSFDEACAIASNALGVNMDLLTDDWRSRNVEDEEDVDEEMLEFISDVEGLLTGTITWDCFTNIWTNDEGLEDINPMMFVQMIYMAHTLYLI